MTKKPGKLLGEIVVENKTAEDRTTIIYIVDCVCDDVNGKAARRVKGGGIKPAAFLFELTVKL